MKDSPKLAIVQSLDSMDQVQMECVLKYIKDILFESTEMDRKSFKKAALKEIRKALKQTRKADNLHLAA
jgi:hypothetical protein